MSELIKYDAARFALQQAVAVDEVKDIRDKAQAMALYAKQAKDTELVQWATEIKVRAERRAGQMLAELGLKPGPKTISSSVLPIEISKTQSSRWQKLAAVPEDQFEQAVAAAKEVAGEVTTAAMLRVERALNPKPQSTKPAPVDEPTTEPASDETSELRDANAELAESMQQLMDENKSMLAVFQADDKLAVALAEIKRLTEVNRILEERIRGLMNEVAAAKQAAVRHQKRADKCEKAKA